jgi:transcriptional regulator of acetoin/glycerol metabolism
MIERLVVLARNRHIEVADLPESFSRRAAEDAGAGTLDDLERVRILEVLRDTAGNKKLAASRLGIHRSTLYAKLRRYGVIGDNGGSDDSCGEPRRRLTPARAMKQ